MKRFKDKDKVPQSQRIYGVYLRDAPGRAATRAPPNYVARIPFGSYKTEVILKQAHPIPSLWRKIAWRAVHASRVRTSDKAVGLGGNHRSIVNPTSTGLKERADRRCGGGGEELATPPKFTITFKFSEWTIFFKIDNL
ncbi:hypothetical protein EVAR_93846_1 [Eumeta japonica]|uniref:Uncharacterized protein n=1 Tax=Eumeta variegata TaxID=151549 RepID=A0A4C1TWL5_EUMVA|nr:hypothetical protein EVAR_93846_1 [Eumeta japonica]